MFGLRSTAFAIAALAMCTSLSPLAESQTPTPQRTPILVELFTSEGCSSCPPADALLGKLAAQPINGAEIIVLGEHVDYWDGQGWHDRFSSPQFTQRQKDYGQRLNIESIYTPQMIVDGTDQFVGNDGSHAQSSIQHARQTPKLHLALSRPTVDGRRISASLSSASPVPSDKIRGDLYIALVDPTDTTEVRGGENRGHTLHHAGVVRTLQRVGSLKDLSTGKLSFNLNAPPDANLSQMRLVAFAQQSGPGVVLGAVATNIIP
jgi:hypothetical protein